VIWPERRTSLSRPEYLGVREAVRSCEGVAAVNGRSMFNLTGEAEAARLEGVFASSNFFTLLGADAALGRTFLPGEDGPGRDAVVVLSYGLWQRRFGGDPAVLGRTLTLHSVPRTVIGVMPRDFALPSPATELWVPLPLYRDAPGPGWASRYLTLIGRLKPDVPVAVAVAELRPIAAALKREYPNNDPDDIVERGTVVTLREFVVGATRPMFLALGGAVDLLLLIACANVANLLVARGISRQREFAIRAALGADRGRLVRQLLVESALLGCLGGVLGLTGATWGARAIAALLPETLPGLDAVTLDGPAALFALGLSAATGLLFGLAPAFRGARADLGQPLREGRAAAGTATARRFHRRLTIAEIALASVLLAGAGLLARSLWNVLHVDPGFQPAGVAAVQLAPPPDRYRDPDARRAFYDEVLAGLRALPGVTTAGAIQHLPLGGSAWTLPVYLEGETVADGVEAPTAHYRVVTPGYFSTMGLRVLRGRALSDDDRPGHPQAAIVSEALARRLWPGQDPLGRRVRTIIGPRDWIEVVGIVADVRADALDVAPPGELYRPYAQDPQAAVALVIKSAEDPRRLASEVRALVHRVDRDVAVSDLRALEDLVAASTVNRRASATLIGCFALAALLLGAVGVYGVVTYAVNQRTREFGVRLALGARRGEVFRLVLGEALRLVSGGLAIGLGLATVGSRWLGALLFEVRPLDPFVLAAAAIALLTAAVFASWVPARRATRVDPLVALRAE
jgi:putative ABC transport system permease protein